MSLDIKSTATRNGAQELQSTSVYSHNRKQAFGCGSSTPRSAIYRRECFSPHRSRQTNLVFRPEGNTDATEHSPTVRLPIYAPRSRIFFSAIMQDRKSSRLASSLQISLLKLAKIKPFLQMISHQKKSSLFSGLFEISDVHYCANTRTRCRIL